MIGLLFIFGIFLAFGMFFLLAERLGLPTLKASRAILNTGKQEMKKKRIIMVFCIAVVLCLGSGLTVYASGDVAGAIEGTWSEASGQIKAVVNKVVFPVIDLILAVFFFAKLGTAYFDYRKHGQFEWTAPAILFACLVFTLTTPTYIWSILGM